MNTHKNLDDLIRESLKTNESPSIALNNRLKLKLYETEQKRISLWYLPMLLNSLVFILFNIVTQLLVQQIFIIKIANFISIYLIISGIILTIIGLKYANFRNILAIERKGLR